MADVAAATSKAIALQSEVTRLLGQTLGATGNLLDFKVPSWKIIEIISSLRSPVSDGIVGGLLYACIFYGLPRYFLENPSSELLRLSVWGSVYYAFAAITAQITCAAVSKTLKEQIIPRLSEEASGDILLDLRNRFTERRLNWGALLASIFATVVSGIALYHDLPAAPVSEIIICCSGFCFLYFLSARVTDAARFYGSFASFLHIDKDRVFGLDPLREPLVLHISLIGRQILVFWFGIGCSVITLYPLFRDLEIFVFVVIPIASFFSLAFGTLIFLQSERDVRFVARDLLTDAIKSVDRDILELFEARAVLSSEQWQRLRQLEELRAKMIGNGWSQSVVLQLVSVAAPFVGPAASVLVATWPKH